MENKFKNKFYSNNLVSSLIKKLVKGEGSILLFHHVLPDYLFNLSDIYSITTTYFEQIIQQMINLEYRFVSIDCLIEILDDRGEGHFICLTFDDGYSDTFEYAFPILKKYNIPFVLYLSTDFPDGLIELNNVISWEQLEILSHSELCTIGAHTSSHENLARLNEIEIFETINKGIERTKIMLNTIPAHFAYPFGNIASCSIREENIVRSIGFRTIVTTRQGNVFKRHKNYLYRLPRINMTEGSILNDRLYIDVFKRNRLKKIIFN